MFSCAALAAGLLCGSQAAAHAATQADAPAEAPAETGQSIHVNSIRNPELKSYRVMAAGLDAFDEYHALAPGAREVRFKLVASSRAPADAMQDLALRIAGNETSIALPLAADGSFTLPRSAQADSEDADLVTNKKKGNYRWQPSIHSDGVPAGMRRLGDLRLQCQVTIAIAKKEIPFWIRTLVGTLLRTTDWCASEQLKMHTRSDQAIASATLLDGERRIALKVEKEGRAFLSPIGDTRYGDDTLIELLYQPDAAGAPPAAP
ncbi:hypothetical protein GCN74_07280 [Janthinobacterium sp. FT14W]|uniref:hypothetical protein n=1 Tax=Janthinobacterium sp. FT14W TaxID=2654253 RepID=UPI0012658119|nr:hypothetical protein [Janthinobacterium sp. FT14W]KAB8060781.1 hypothetical protein GCN74_07280 [Janthinobacterium sp. FT14W]